MGKYFTEVIQLGLNIDHVYLYSYNSMPSFSECNNMFRAYMKRVDDAKQKNSLMMNLDGLEIYKEYLELTRRGCDIFEIPHTYRVKLYSCDMLFYYKNLFEQNKDKFTRDENIRATSNINDILKLQRCVR